MAKDNMAAPRDSRSALIMPVDEAAIRRLRRWLPAYAPMLALAACLHWVHWDGPRLANPECDARRVMAELDSSPQPDLGWIDRHVAFLSTWLKRRGINGWRETYCTATATGALVRPARHSNDGFWTLDLQLDSLSVDGRATRLSHRYIRIEVEPGTPAHVVAGRTRLETGARLTVHGVMVIDTDRSFLEIHPDTGLRILRP